MNTSIHTQQDQLRLAEEAADWLMRLEEDHSPECRAAFFAWIQQSAWHVREFLFVTEEFRKLDDMDPGKRIDIEALLAESKANVVNLQSDAGELQTETGRIFDNRRTKKRPHKIKRTAASSDGSGASRARSNKTWRWTIGLAAAVVLALGIQSVFPLIRNTQTYSTAAGEQRSFKLADGSVIHLNAQSRAQVHFSSGARDIRLLDGEALFVVARDPARPFRVATDTTTVQALGTQFNVYRQGSKTTVSVMEGAVRVFAGEAPQDKQVSRETEGTPLTPTLSPQGWGEGKKAAPTLAAGDEAEVINGVVLVKHDSADIASAVAWRQRRLVFNDDRLSDVAAEFNRYNRTQIQVEGAAANKQLIGIFNADDPESLVLFLAKDQALQIERGDDSIVIRMR